MDDPLSNLDAKLRIQMRAEITKIHKEVGATTIYVTHDQTEAMTMASRIVVMKLGRVQQIGSPIEIYNNPANLFVAGFIGSPAMNFFHVDYSAEDNSITFASGEKVVLPKTLTKGKSIPSKVIFGIRPEDIKEVDGETKVTGPEFDIDVNVAELLGNEYYVHADFGGTELVSKIPANRVIKTGDKIKVFFDLKKIHFFDPETEKSI